MDDVEPVLRTPVSDMAAAMFTQQMGRPNKCGDFELRYKLCVEAYGKGLGKSKCQDYFDDLDECINMRKQRARFNAMYDERLRQYRAGERKSEDYYGPVPQKDSY